MEDTVENQVKGLAEQIIADDEKRRAQELVRRQPPQLHFSRIAHEDKKGRVQHRSQAAELGSEA